MTTPPDNVKPAAPPESESEPFLSRWSRLKREAREPVEPPAAAPQTARYADSPPPQLPPVDKLTPESDFRGFLHPKVDEGLRRAALKKLFSDPHFNVMDGLDVYIDDYSKSEPLPAALLAQLAQAQKILDWAREKKEAAPAPAIVATSTGITPGDGNLITPAESTTAPVAGEVVDNPVEQPAGLNGPRSAD